MFRTIVTELTHTIMCKAHCINERLNFLCSYLLSYGKMAILNVIDVQFVDVTVLYLLIFCSNKTCESIV